MKLKSIISTALLATLLVAPGCKDEFADLNTDPGKVTEANIPYLFTQGVIDFEPSDYLLWFYNGRYTAHFVQAFVPTGGLEGNFNEMGATGGQGEKFVDVLKIAREIDFQTSLMTEEDAAQFVHIRTMLDPLLVYMGLHDSDTYGDRPFKDAAKAQYTDPPLLTPEYDELKDLYELWLAMLDNSMDVLSNTVTVNGKEITQNVPILQDIIYGADRAKWCKLANSLKLKIAVRLLHVDKARALKIAEEVVNSTHGVLDGSADDMIFNKGLSGSGINDQIYHFGDEINRTGAANRNTVAFLISNKDPRVRFFYGKNDFNSKVVQAFLDQNVTIPSYIEQYVEYTDASKTKFKEWKAPGEPWVRYQGLPGDLNASQNTEYAEYFNSNLWKLDNGDALKTYYPYSKFNEELVRGRVEYTIPVAPGATVIQDKQQNPWYGMYMSTAEVNLYLAELSLLGANIGSADTYFQKAVKHSVEAYDRLASLNKIPYYGTTYNYDENEVVIDLQNGEINTLLDQEAYKLTGVVARDLEKVYIQQYLHFMYQPTEQFVSVRRSGVPKVGSDLLAWQTVIDSNQIPRRMEISNPSPTDLMHDNIKKAMEKQGFTTGNGINPALLNSERVWYDKEAPNFGEGPKF